MAKKDLERESEREGGGGDQSQLSSKVFELKMFGAKNLHACIFLHKITLEDFDSSFHNNVGI